MNASLRKFNRCLLLNFTYAKSLESNVYQYLYSDVCLSRLNKQLYKEKGSIDPFPMAHIGAYSNTEHFITIYNFIFSVSVGLVIALVVTSSSDPGAVVTGAGGGDHTCMTPGCIGDQCVIMIICKIYIGTFTQKASKLFLKVNYRRQAIFNCAGTF